MSEILPKRGLMIAEIKQLIIAPAEMIVALFPEGIILLSRSLIIGK